MIELIVILLLLKSFSRMMSMVLVLRGADSILRNEYEI